MNVALGAPDKMGPAKNQLKWGPMDVVVIALLVSFCIYVFHRVDSVLIYKWDWSVIPGYLFRWDEEANKFLPNDIAVHRLHTVNDEAHARFDANSRTYQYLAVTFQGYKKTWAPGPRVRRIRGFYHTRFQAVSYTHLTLPTNREV